jgi:hypothetical protein
VLAGGGLYAIFTFGLSETHAHQSSPPPPAVVVFHNPGQTILAPTDSTIQATPTSEAAAMHLALNAIDPSITPSTGAVTAPLQTFTPSITLSPTITLTPSITPTPTETLTPTPTITNTSLPFPNTLGTSYLPVVSQRAIGTYQYGLTLGNNPNVFSRLGDCHSSSPGFLGAFDSPSSYRLGPFTDLQDVINYYAGAFSNPSQAAYSGLHMGSFFSPLWARPDFCEGSENVMDCEYRRYHPSIIFINIGTLNMASPDEEYERFVRPIIEFWISKGVVPILNTKADNIEGGDRFNIIMRRLAYEYDMPLWDFALVAHALPNNGLGSDNVHLSEGSPYFDDPVQMQTGWTLRNLTGLQALNVVWRGLH